MKNPRVYKCNFRRNISWGMRIISTLLVLIIIIGVNSPSQIAKAYSNIYVSTKGIDNSTCGSSSAPCNSIQYAVGKASSGDSILVGGGTYTYNAAADTCTFLVTRAVVCYVNKSLTIVGGYNSSNWSVRDVQKYPSIIDGRNTYRGVAVVAYNAPAHMSMDGFTIQNGLAQGGQGSDQFVNGAYGGGIWAQASSVNLKNMIFLNNRAAGANLNNSPSGGAGAGGGVAILSTLTGSSTFDNIVFDGNQALGGSGVSRGGVGFGGAIFTYESALTATNLTLTNNTAKAGNSTGSGFDGGLYADALGGAIGLGGGTISLSRITAVGNHAFGGNAGASGTAGGAFGGGLYIENGNLSLVDSRIQGNQAIGGVAKIGGSSMGGGIMANSTQSTISRVWVIANTSRSGGSSTSYQAGTAGGGGGYFVYWGTSGVYTTVITNAVFADNLVELGTPGANVGGGGGGATFQGVQATVLHSTFAHNSLGPGLVIGQAIGVVGNGGGTSPALGNLTMRYSIISDHVGSGTASALNVAQNNSATLSYVLFANNAHNTNQDSIPMLPGNFTITHPIYKTSVGYVSMGSPNYDYHLTSNSCAIDQAVGSNTTIDIDDQFRPKGAAPDVGAVEGSAPAFTVNSKVFVPSVRR